MSVKVNSTPSNKHHKDNQRVKMIPRDSGKPTLPHMPDPYCNAGDGRRRNKVRGECHRSEYLERTVLYPLSPPGGQTPGKAPTQLSMRLTFM